MLKILLALAVFVCDFATLLAAPVPVKRPVKPQTCREGIIAARQLNWTSDDTVRFYKEGGYEWTSGSCKYVGTWRMTGHRTMSVREAVLDSTDGKLGAWMEWEVTLRRVTPTAPWTGRVSGDYGTYISVRLSPGERLKMPKEKP